MGKSHWLLLSKRRLVRLPIKIFSFNVFSILVAVFSLKQYSAFFNLLSIRCLTLVRWPVKCGGFVF